MRTAVLLAYAAALACSLLVSAVEHEACAPRPAQRYDPPQSFDTSRLDPTSEYVARARRHTASGKGLHDAQTGVKSTFAIQLVDSVSGEPLFEKQSLTAHDRFFNIVGMR